MVGSIVATLNAIKLRPMEALGKRSIDKACAAVGHCWRQGPLNPAITIALFLEQVARGNVACSEVRHIAACGKDNECDEDDTDNSSQFTASAYCQARQRLPLQVFKSLARGVCDELAAEAQVTRKGSGKASSNADACDAHDCALDYRWHGHRTFHVDASSFSMPDTPELQKQFGQHGAQKPGCGFPIAHLLTLFDARTGLVHDAIAAPLRTHEMSQVSKTHAQLQSGDVMIGDDSFGTYAHFALLLQANLHGLFPAHHQRIVSFTPARPHVMPKDPAKGIPRSRWIQSLGEQDQLVEWFKPPKRPDWMTAEQYASLPKSIVVRETRRTLTRKGFRPITLTCVTTLNDAVEYPPDELFELRLRRWDVETNLRHLKTTMGMEVLRCKSVAGVLKELAVFTLVYNLVRSVMLCAARRQGVAVDRISFADTLAWLRNAKPGDTLKQLIVNPLRPDRFEPRAIKRRPKEYDRLNKPRAVMRQNLQNLQKPVLA